MGKLKLSLLNKWELDKDYNSVFNSVMLHDGRAFVLISEKESFNRYCLLEVSPLGVKEIGRKNLYSLQMDKILASSRLAEKWSITLVIFLIQKSLP